jgi:endoglucanase
VPRPNLLRPTALLPVLLLVVMAVVGCGNDGSDPAGDGSSDSSAAGRFLDSYLTHDGRVLRTDQGGDIVSEGQAYGMLIAELAGREELVPVIWSWTKQHLQRSDGLLSFHADADGNVTGADPASDADVLAAYALLNYDGTDSSTLHRDGESLAKAVLQHEVVSDAQGRPVLVAGPWAAATSIVNPSYLMPSVFEALASLTSDDTWSGLADSSTALLQSATQDGSLLPPDWSRLDGSTLVPVADASGASGPAQYGPDAQRVPLWFAASCAEDDRHLAGRWWTLLQQDDRSAASALTTSGDPRDSSASPVALLASAASARAAGDTSGAADLSRGASQAAQGRPTYYGDAWLALAPGLSQGKLAACD